MQSLTLRLIQKLKTFYPKMNAIDEQLTKVIEKIVSCFSGIVKESTFVQLGQPIIDSALSYNERWQHRLFF